MSVSDVVKRLKGMNSGTLCWKLLQPDRTASTPVEGVVMKQTSYEAMPAKCAKEIITVLKSLPRPEARKARKLPVPEVKPKPSEYSVALADCNTVEKVCLPVSKHRSTVALRGIL
eukprot:m.253474 g.253474  ORF g.253474 m.253474 type:complete len:115 (-) comp17539_c0_seq5:22-366(-)